jgi:hypothetical protein
MPKNVGRYQQGSIKTQGEMGDEFLAGDKTPTKAAPAGPVPKNQVPVRDNGGTVGNNDGHKAH